VGLRWCGGTRRANLGGSHDKAQIEAKYCDPLDRPEVRQDRASGPTPVSWKPAARPDTTPHHRDAAGACNPDDRLLTIRWQKPPSKKRRQILLAYNVSRSEVRPERFERRARLVSAIARGRQWLDDVVSGRVTTVAELCAREKCSVRQVNLTISLAFLAPNLVKAAIEGRLPRGIGVERLRDLPAEWNRQFEALGLNPECS
jgi:hypothetical protein